MCKSSKKSKNIRTFAPYIYDDVILSNVNLQVDARGISLGCKVEGAEVKDPA